MISPNRVSICLDDLSHHLEFLKEIDSALGNDANSDDAIDDESQSEPSNVSDQSNYSDLGENDATISASDAKKGESSSQDNEKSAGIPNKSLFHKSISCLQIVCSVLQPMFDYNQTEKVSDLEKSCVEKSLSRDFCIRLYGLTLYKLAVAKAEMLETEDVEKIFDDSIKVFLMEGKKDHRRLCEVSFTAATVLKSLGKTDKAKMLLESSIVEMKNGIHNLELELIQSQDDEREFLREEIQKCNEVLQEIEDHLSQLKSSLLKNLNVSQCSKCS